MLCQVDEVSRFLAGQAAGAQPRGVHAHDRGGAQRADRFEQLLPDTFRRRYRYLLAYYRARQHRESVAAASQVGAFMVADQHPQHGVAACQFASGVVPVRWRHDATGLRSTAEPERQAWGEMKHFEYTPIRLRRSAAACSHFSAEGMRE